MLAEPTISTPVLYCTFWIGQRQFGVPVLMIKEVRAATSTTPIPGAPRGVRGYVNLRGNLYLLIDAGELLTGDTTPVSSEGDFIVFKDAAGENFALQTDCVGEIVEICVEQIVLSMTDAGQSPSPQPGVDRLIIGHAKLDHTLLTLVEPSELLPAVFEAG